MILFAKFIKFTLPFRLLKLFKILHKWTYSVLIPSTVEEQNIKRPYFIHQKALSLLPRTLSLSAESSLSPLPRTLTFSETLFLSLALSFSHSLVHHWRGGSVDFCGFGCGCGRVGCRHLWLGKCGKKKMGVAVWVVGMCAWGSVRKKLWIS